MGAGRGWIGDPQPPVEWCDSHYSRQAGRANAGQHHVPPADGPLSALNIHPDVAGAGGTDLVLDKGEPL